MPLSISLKGPLILIAIGALVALVTYPNTEPPTLFFIIGGFWALFTTRARRTYWNARLRTRASMDERASRSRASKD